MRRLKQAEIAAFRKAELEKQGGKCAICGLAVALGEAVLDHDHSSGVVRGVLHRGCNAMLGHIENNAPRHGLTDMVKMARFLGNVQSYRATFAAHLCGDRPLHPTFKTDDEKRLLRNKRARAARAKAKEKQ